TRSLIVQSSYSSVGPPLILYFMRPRSPPACITRRPPGAGTRAASLSKLEITPDLAGATIAAILRKHFPDRSWSAVRQLVAARRSLINTDLCLDPARRLKAGGSVEVLDQPLPKPPAREDIVIRHVDRHVVVVEKPAGIPTVRHPAERDWPAQRKVLVPTLDDLVLGQIRQNEKAPVKGKRPRLRIVHRLDKETSGLVVFARTVEAEPGL